MSFLNDLSFGQEGEAYLKEWIEKRGASAELTEDKASCDIILPATNTKIEVKSDRWTLTTGNICLELWSHLPNGTPGWVQVASADVLAYLLYNERNVVADVLFYNFWGLRDFIFWNVLNGDWYNEKPLLGEIKSAGAAGNTKVRNLLIPRRSLRNFELRHDWFVTP